MQPMAFQNPPALETRVRFTVRSMLVGTTLIAVGAALLAPWFHQWSAEQRLAFLMAWCNLGLGAGLTIAAACVQRVRAEKRAGPARYRLSRSKTWPVVLMALIWSPGIICYSALKILQAGAVPFALGSLFDLMGLQQGMMIAVAALGIWWRTDCLELCDAGLLQGSRVFPWEHFRGFRWGTFDPNMLILQGRWSISTWRVSPDDKATIEQFLANHVGGSKQDGEQPSGVERPRH